MNDVLPHQRVQLDSDFLAIPLDGTEDASVRLALVVRQEADPSDGPFCRLRQLADANVYLACFIDRSGHILKWLEVWVRDYDNIAETLHENAFDIINNDVLDARWERQRQILTQSEASHVYSTAFDEQSECPLYIDIYHKEAVLPKDESANCHWTICKEDNLLKRLGLAPFSTTVHRYLYLAAKRADSFFLPVTPNAPTASCTRSLESEISVRSTLLPFNRYGGSMLVRECAPMGIRGYLDVVSGKSWTGMGVGRKNFLPKGIYKEVTDDLTVGYAAGRLVAARVDTRSWRLESLFLKTRLFYEIVSLVKKCVELDRKPFFALETDSFAISLPNTSETSPFLWDAEVALNQISDAIDFSVEKQTDVDTRESTYFRTFRALPASIYRPEALGQQRSFTGEVTLLDIKRDRDTGLYVIDGALRSNDLQNSSIGGKSLYFIDYPVRGTRLRLVADMTGGDAQHIDKIRFKTRKLPLTSEQEMALESFRGVEQVGVYCEVLPILGTPCDLYSLGVVGLELLFHGTGSPLALIKDHVRSLALNCSDMDESTPLVERIAKILGEDEEARAVLMPDALGVGAAGKGRIGIPAEDHVWETLISVAMKMLSGLLKREGYSSTLSNENNFRLVQVFDEPLSELSHVLAILRSLCVGDVHSTHMIREVIDSMLGDSRKEDL
ncbi:MAG: hypothetical protein ACSHYA_06825 [Opitutaceae bacterium]